MRQIDWDVVNAILFVVIGREQEPFYGSRNNEP